MEIKPNTSQVINKGGRPTLEEAAEKARLEKNEKIGEGVSKMDEDRLKKLEDAFAIRCTILQACDYADIAIQTYYNWIEKKPELLERFDRARRGLGIVAKRNKAKAVHEGNLTESQRLLEHEEPENYSEITRLEHSGSISHPLELSSDEDNKVISEGIEAIEKQLKEMNIKRIKEHEHTEISQANKPAENNP